MDKRTIAVLASAALLRWLLFTSFPGLPATLANRVEISTPVTGYKRLQEGVYLYTHGVSPYDGGVFHQAPILLALFGALPSSEFAINLVYILADLLSAIALVDISNSGVATKSRLFSSGRKEGRWAAWAVAAVFLFNPFTMATCLARPTIVFTNTVVLTAISKAVKGHSVSAILAIAMAGYLSLYPALLLPPLILLAYDSKIQNSPRKAPQSQSKFAITHTLIFLLSTAALLGLSFLITSNSWEFLGATYGVHLLLPDLTPNVGLWWYFFIEMFDSFREFFLCVFQLHLVGYVGALTIRLRKQPLFAIITLLGIFSIFKSYPSIGDTGAYLGLLALYSHVIPLTRYGFIGIMGILYATLLGPAFYYLWIYAGSGNANFFYAITLVWGLVNALLVVSDTLFAVLRDEYEMERPDMRGKVLLQI
ncbi:GPI transamidase subunit PIG-U [Peziza echinospora]|nr:GPI transamidase subunit PIG-U [Peziza echinospora]